jgi:alpha-L-rhamnosidase
MSHPPFRVTHPRCEYLVNPLGLDERRPRLSWRMETRRRGARQSAYRILVASSVARLARGLGDRWDSGVVRSPASSQIEYRGSPLVSRAACHWRVEVWDERGRSARSAAAHWSMGLLETAEWRAEWIGASPAIVTRNPWARAASATQPGTPGWFRRPFHVPGRVRRATLYASARGLVELHLNGERVTPDLLVPEWTDYDRRIQYRTFDVTNRLGPGPAVLGAVLGDGWWSGYVGWQETRARYGDLVNSFIAQLEIELEDGGRVVVVSDRSWRADTGPIRQADFMLGEIYDARHELPGWGDAGFDDRRWLPVRAVAPPRAPLVAQRAAPVRVGETVRPIRRTRVGPRKFIFDLGQNITGWVRLRARGRTGLRVTLRHGERLNPDGSLYTENLRRAAATDHYTFKGAGWETWEPRFTFHGFQYVELTGLEAAAARDAIVGCVVGSDCPPAGRFNCSHEGVNRLWLNGLWSQRCNFLSVPTDCPQRDERLGWTGDAQVFLRTATYNRDVAGFFTKWMVDVEDAQTPAGIFPDTAPRLREGKNFIGLDRLGGAAGWADAGVIVPWTLWRVYGDTRIAARHWAAMCAWMDYLARTNPDGVRRRKLGNNYGDWLCIPTDTSFRTPSPMKCLLATAYWADDAAKLAQMAKALGRRADERHFQAVFARVRTAFQRTFLKADGQLAVETQTAYVLALGMNLLPEEVRARSAERLAALIEAAGWHLSTGFIGVSHLNPILTLAGRADLAYRLLLQESFPSWLYPVNHGATTIWERWNGWTAEEGFFNPQMNSFNHYSLGSIGEWLFRHVAGIELDPEIPGFSRFVLRPFPGGDLTRARASYDSICGEIVSAWSRRGAALTWRIRIPPNTEARVEVPADEGTAVTESGRPILRAPGLKVLGREGGRLICQASPGRYVLRSVWRGPSTAAP